MTPPRDRPTATAHTQALTAPDLGWTLHVIAREVSVHAHHPKLTAAERTMAGLPLESPRFALSYAATLDGVLARL
jgi:hypothetical protein